MNKGYADLWGDKSPQIINVSVGSQVIAVLPTADRKHIRLQIYGLCELDLEEGNVFLQFIDSIKSITNVIRYRMFFPVIILDLLATSALFVLVFVCMTNRCVIKPVQIVIELDEKLALNRLTETAAQLFYRGDGPVFGARRPLAFPDISSMWISYFD